MLVQTCTQRKPASVLQHRTGQVELCSRSTHSIHRLCADVKRFLPRIFCLLSLPDLSTDLLVSLCSLGSRVHLRAHATQRVAPRAAGEGKHLVLSKTPPPCSSLLPASSLPL